jgi:hypothetical protein
VILKTISKWLQTICLEESFFKLSYKLSKIKADAEKLDKSRHILKTLIMSKSILKMQAKELLSSKLSLVNGGRFLDDCTSCSTSCSESCSSKKSRDSIMQ